MREYSSSGVRVLFLAVSCTTGITSVGGWAPEPLVRIASLATLQMLPRTLAAWYGIRIQQQQYGTRTRAGVYLRSSGRNASLLLAFCCVQA